MYNGSRGKQNNALADAWAPPSEKSLSKNERISAKSPYYGFDCLKATSFGSSKQLIYNVISIDMNLNLWDDQVVSTRTARGYAVSNVS
jgi:hypothetical protein